jgi:hypothetical protein
MREVVRSPISLLQEDWSYVPSPVSLLTRRLRLQQRLLARIPAPGFTVLRAPAPHPRWNLLFLFLPQGRLDADQREILARIRALSGRLLVVFAAPDGTPVPPEIELADAIARKDLEGFDFSGYTLGLWLIAQGSPGADVYVQNDSVFGPFGDIDEYVARARWDLTGFLASANVENHISTFAFILRAVTPVRMAALSDVLSRQWCHNQFGPVVISQETRLARVASRTMGVGAFFYMPVRPAASSWRRRIHTRLNPAAEQRYPLDASGDPTLGTPFELLDLGFPFLKRSLFTKFAGLHESMGLHTALESRGWVSGHVEGSGAAS